MWFQEASRLQSRDLPPKIKALDFVRGFFYFYQMQITGIILAGGKSTRMGTDKALLKIEGETLLAKAVKLCRSVCDEILISSNSEDHNVENIVRIPDEIKDCGPLGGIYSCLRQAENEWSFVISVDATFVKPEFVSFLVNQKFKNYDAVVPFHEKGKEPLIALYNKSTLPFLEKNLEDGIYKMHFLLENHKTNFVDAQKWIKLNPLLFHNINFPDDLINI